MKRIVSPYIIGRYRQLWQTLVIYGLVIVLVALTEFLGWWVGVRDATASLVRPLLLKTTAYVQTLALPYQVIQRGFRSARRIQDLEIKYSQSLAAISQLTALQAENAALRAMIENTDRTTQQVVISSPIVSLSRPAVGVGRQQGVTTGNLVIIAGTLVGRISQVEEQISLVDLLTSRDAFSLVAKTPRNVEGIIQSDGSHLVMKEIPVDAPIDIGERVVTVGQPGVPPDLLVGQVGQITTHPARPTKEVLVDQLVSFYQVRLVEIYKNSLQNYDHD